MTVQSPELAGGEQLDAAVSAAAQAASQAEAAHHMRGLFGRDSIYLLVWAVQVGIAALSIPINTRLLGGEFGVVTTALAVMQVLVAIGVFSLPISVQRAYRTEDGGRDARRVITLSMGTAAITLYGATHHFARRIRRLRPPPLRLVGAGTLAALVAGATTAIPAGGVYAVGRSVVALACAAVFGVLLQRLVAPERPLPRPRLARARR